jgi:aldose sugar dehydrogenase
MGPTSRITEFKSIEVSLPPSNLQQLRWPPTNIANTAAEAISRLFLIPGAHYSDPEFSWKFAVAPAGIGFLKGRELGPQYEGDLFVGAARTTLAGGYRRLSDRVADNTAKFDLTESETLFIGRDFGVGTDIQTGPNGNLFVVSRAVFRLSWTSSIITTFNSTLD